jgi:quinol monooxygenase YgiN
MEAIMALAVIARITVQEGKNEEFETLFLELTEKVLANEKGALMYTLTRSKSNPQEYVVMEQYRSAADIDAHGKTDYFREANKAMGALVMAAPVIEVLDIV